MVCQTRRALFLLLLLCTGPQVLEVEAGPALCVACLTACGAAIILGSIGTVAAAAATGGAGIAAGSPLAALITQHCSMCAIPCIAPTP